MSTNNGINGYVVVYSYNAMQYSSENEHPTVWIKFTNNVYWKKPNTKENVVYFHLYNFLNIN